MSASSWNIRRSVALELAGPIAAAHMPTDLAAIVIDYALMDDADAILHIIATRVPGDPLEVRWAADGAWPYRDFMLIGVPCCLQERHEYCDATTAERVAMLEAHGLTVDHKPMMAVDVLAYANWLSCAARYDSAYSALMRVIRAAA